MPEHDISFCAGALVGVFTFGEFLTGIVWARVSDRIGRKPTLMIGIFSGLVAALSLGFSQSVAVAIASRAFGGLFNPNVGLVQTCTGELAGKEQQGKTSGTRRWRETPRFRRLTDIETAKAFSLVSFIRSFG